MSIDKFLNVYSLGGSILVILLIIGVAGLPGNGAADAADQKAIKGVEAVVYKSPNCGCCGIWAQYAERRGMNVEVRNVDDINGIKDERDVPTDLRSCHTTIVEGYVVEGHIPTKVINQLLLEKPDINGIAMPGMPSGSPGMPGPKQGEWTIYTLHENGETSEFATV